MSRSIRIRKAPRISIFNHKGGVGKTTLTVNIAGTLGALGKRVLLVDSDPQCNLTSYVIDELVVNDLLDRSDGSLGRTLWSAVKPVVEGTEDIRVIKPYQLSQDNLYILPGDVQLAEFENDLNDKWRDCFQRKLRGFRGTSALSRLVDEVVQNYAIDYVFYDSGPNIGPLNRVVLLDSSHFIVPTACDVFSVRALKTLGHTLGTWISEWETVRDFAPDDVALLPGHPELLGYIAQRFRIYRGEIASGPKAYLPKIEKHIYSDVAVVLRRVDTSLAPHNRSSLKMGVVQDFGTAATESQAQGQMINESRAGTAQQRANAKRVFLDIAKKILQRTKKG